MKEHRNSLVGMLWTLMGKIAPKVASIGSAALLIVAVSDLSGCIIVPVPLDHVNGRAVTADPLTIKVGTTTEEDILLRLGDPDVIWNKGVFIYTWDHVTWGVLILVYGGGGGVGEILPPHQMLLIQFDDHGFVQRVDRTEVRRDAKLEEYLKAWVEKGKTNAKP